MVFHFQVMAEALSITDSLKVTAIGLLVVFAVLAILIFFIEGITPYLRIESLRRKQKRSAHR